MRRSRYAARARGMRRFLRALAARFVAERGLSVAASLTYTTLLALVPMLAIALAVMTTFPAFDVFAAATQRYLEENLLPPRVGETVLGHLREFSAGAAQLTLVGLAALAVSAYFLMSTIESAFDAIWRVRERRPLALRLAAYALVVTLGPLLVGASLTITSYAVSASLGLVGRIPGGPGVLLFLAQLLLTATAFTLLYYLVPNRPVLPRHALAGGVTAALLFEVANRGFAAYIAQVSTYTLIYGAFAVVPLFLVWLYLSWGVTLAGAVLAAMLPDYGFEAAGGRRPAAPALGDVLRVLGALVQVREGAEKPTTPLVAAQARLPLDRCEATLEALARGGWAVRTLAGRWSLGCDPDAVTVAEVYDGLARAADTRDRQPEAVEALLARSEAAVRTALAVPLTALRDRAAAAR